MTCISNIKQTTRLSNCKRLETEEKVQDNQAITPAQMYSLAQQGKPISTHQLPAEYFDDGEPFQSYDLPIDRQRGIDVIDCWNASKDSESKFNDFKKKGVKTNANTNE